jgi:hypothetical protein
MKPFAKSFINSTVNPPAPAFHGSIGLVAAISAFFRMAARYFSFSFSATEPTNGLPL